MPVTKISVFANHEDGSLNVPRIPEDREFLKQLTANRTVICGSTVATQIPRSLKKIVIRRMEGFDYNRLVMTIMQNLPDDRSYIVYGGWRVYAEANKHVDMIVRIKVSADTQRAETNKDDVYGYTTIPENFVLLSERDLSEYINTEKKTGHMVQVYRRIGAMEFNSLEEFIGMNTQTM